MSKLIENDLVLNVYRLIPGLLFFISWEILMRIFPDWAFYLGVPSQILSYLWIGIKSGEFIWDFWVTFFETFAGFLLGNIVGTLIGLSLWFSKTVFEISKPYIIILGATPIFALAPIMILWFGTGILSKILIAGFSTVFIALFQAYSGADDVSLEDYKLLQSFQASKIQIFRKVIAPSSLVWVVSAFRINVGFALLGAFIGEFLSSNEGLGHMIIVASGLYNISKVFTGVFGMLLIALILNYWISLSEESLKRFFVRIL